MAPQPFTAWTAIIKRLQKHKLLAADLDAALAEAKAKTGGKVKGLEDVAPENALAAYEKKLLGGPGGRADKDSLYSHLTSTKASSAPPKATQELLRKFIAGEPVTKQQILDAANRPKGNPAVENFFGGNAALKLPQFLPENQGLVEKMQTRVKGFAYMPSVLDDPPERTTGESSGSESEGGRGKGKGKAKAEPKVEPKAEPKATEPETEAAKAAPPVVEPPAPKAGEGGPSGTVSLSREDALARANPGAPVVSDGEKAAASSGAMKNEEAKAMAQLEVDAAGAVASEFVDNALQAAMESMIKASKGRLSNAPSGNPTAGGDPVPPAAVAPAPAAAAAAPRAPPRLPADAEVSREQYENAQRYFQRLATGTVPPAGQGLQELARDMINRYESQEAAMARELDLSQAKGRRAVIRTEATIPTEERVPASAPAERIAGTGEAGTEAAPVENLVLEDVARDAEGPGGAAIATPAQAMKAAGGDSKDDEKEVAGLGIEEAKRRIRALHQVFDSMIKEFREKPHTKDRDDALNSSDPKKVKAHLLSMLKKVRDYYAGSTKGLKVGVIVPADQLIGAILGRAGMSGVAAAPAGSGQPIEAGKVSTASADRVHPGEFLHKAKEDRFGRAISLSIHRRNSGMDAYKRRGVRNHAVPVSQTVTPGPVADPKIRINQNVPFGGVFGGVVQGRNPKSMGIRIKT